MAETTLSDKVLIELSKRGICDGLGPMIVTIIDVIEAEILEGRAKHIRDKHS